MRKTEDALKHTDLMPQRCEHIRFLKLFNKQCGWSIKLASSPVSSPASYKVEASPDFVFSNLRPMYPY